MFQQKCQESSECWKFFHGSLIQVIAENEKQIKYA